MALGRRFGTQPLKAKRREPSHLLTSCQELRETGQQFRQILIRMPTSPRQRSSISRSGDVSTKVLAKTHPLRQAPNDCAPNIHA